MQARALEIYSHLAIVGRWNSASAARAETSGHIPLVLGRDDNERIMGDHLRELGSSVQWNTEPVSVTQQADSVTAVLKLADGCHRNILAAWVTGCDGARSAVRESSGITFAGAPYEHVFFVADTEMTGSMVPDEVNVYLFRDGFHLLFPMRGKDHWRIAGILTQALRDKPDLKFDAVIP